MNTFLLSKKLTAVISIILFGGIAYGQSDPTPASVWDCGEYLWPEVPSPCFEVQIKQKHDHTSMERYRQNGWDTVVTDENHSIVLTCTPNIPVQMFNGTYYVDTIPYNPPDTTFAIGTRMPTFTDDNFSNYQTTLAFPFYFFGIQKNHFVVGANGMVAFGPVPVTNTSSTGPSCPWNYSAGLPWTNSTPGAPSNLEYMRDAIYGVYEDTYPSQGIHTTGNENWGIYYGIHDEYPCRKIICSWNDIPQYSCTNLHCSYQIVCYEATNIIEVHVQERNACSNWNGGNGIIGIQNATGQPQVANSDPAASNGSQAINGKPAAFFPADCNPSTSSLNHIAYRFTPAGSSTFSYGWYRINENGANDTLRNAEEHPDAIDDTLGYFLPMHWNDTAGSYSCRSLSMAHVAPTQPTKYAFYLHYQDANNTPYHMEDTISVGVDTTDTHDTIFIANVEAPNAKIYQRDGQIVVESGNGSPIDEVMVFDMMGRNVAVGDAAKCVSKNGIQQYTFDISASGTYIVKIGQKTAKKIVIVK